MSNKAKNILFRADSSSNIGTGHIMRDLVLASKYKNDNIIFAVQNLDGNINYKIYEANYKTEILQSNDIEELDKLIKKLKIDLLIIDHYEIYYENEKQLKNENLNLKILSFDDTYEKHYCDILLNHNICANAQKYEKLVPKWCELRCGSQYTLLRDEFLEEKELKREKLYDFFIAMGGADTANLNIKILEILPSNLNIVLVTTFANKYLDELKVYIQNKNNITLFINSNEIAKLINQSKFAIITPSVIINEVNFLEIEFIAIKTAKNQDDIYNYLKEKGYKVLSQFSAKTLQKLLQKELINFTQLSIDEKKLVLRWRNDDNIRKWMYSTELISLENHLRYIQSLSTKKDCIYFLVKENCLPIGVIDFTKITTSIAHIGLYSNPNIKRVGSILMQEIVNYGFKKLKVEKLISEVFQNNEKAINLYKKFNFKIIEKKEELLIMELKDENR